MLGFFFIDPNVAGTNLDQNNSNAANFCQSRGYMLRQRLHVAFDPLRVDFAVNEIVVQQHGLLEFGGCCDAFDS